MEGTMRKILSYFEDENIHGIATHLSRCISDYIREQNIKTIEEFNNINRMEIVKRFLQDKGETFEKFTKMLCIKPITVVSDEEFYEDLAIYVDLKLPIFYFTITHDCYDGTDKSRRAIKSRYKGIHMIEGLKFHYESNYERESA